ncbi:WD40/YVTN/BNR-like repeat-containing protein [Halospeciosus flavus]|uniref:WD40/YVTN/BNR-like repeat-containing protein n=1 Tax=Halospeciosus flavus TaxID=3032283 RepID=A0ABD5Z1V6_9EURY|nr:hypothetical protein [Halospeciosus flavus]
MVWSSKKQEPEWRVVEEVPTDKDLYGLVQTVAGPFAIGSGGTLIANRDPENDWMVVLDDGPATDDSRLTAVDVTDDGKRIWMAGSSGSLGCYDVEDRRKYDYSYPKEMTSTWEGIAITGEAGKERGLVANGSGEVLPFRIDGFDVDWETATKPVGGKAASIAALAAGPDGTGYAVDTSGNAFKTTPEGWEDIGIVNAQVAFHDIYAGPQGRVYVAAGDGRIYRYDDSYHSWTPIGVANNPLYAIDIFQGHITVLGGGGIIYEREMNGKRWHKTHSPTTKDLNDLALGYPDAAVGSAGTIIQRPRGHTRYSGTSKDGDNYENRGELWDGANDDKNSGSSSGDSTSGDSTSGDSTSSSSN